MKTSHSLNHSPQLRTRALALGILGFGLFAIIWSLQGISSTDEDKDGVAAIDDPDDNDPCVPYAEFCSMASDGTELDSLSYSLSGGDTTGFETLYLLTNGGGEILETQSEPRFGPQAPGLYHSYALFYKLGEEPLNTSPGNLISAVSFPGVCGQRSDSLAFKIVVNPTFPVEWLDFQVDQEGESAQLRWTVAKEINCASYQVERSLDGRAFEVLGSLPATGENSDLPTGYGFTDEDLPQTDLYYRIRQWDLNGSFSFSELRLLSVHDLPALSLKLYPNPSQGKVQLTTNLSGTYRAKLIGLQGSLLWQGELALGMQPTSLDLSFLSAGVYYLQLEDPKNNIRTSQQLSIQ